MATRSISGGQRERISRAQLGVQLARRRARRSSAFRRCGPPARAAARSTARGLSFTEWRVRHGLSADMARSYSSTVFTLSSARGLGWSSSCVCALMRNLRGQFLPAAICAAIACARARLVDGAQRLGQAVVARSERGGVEAGVARERAACRACAHRGRAGRRRAPARRHRRNWRTRR